MIKKIIDFLAFLFIGGACNHCAERATSTESISASSVKTDGNFDINNLIDDSYPKEKQRGNLRSYFAIHCFHLMKNSYQQLKIDIETHFRWHPYKNLLFELLAQMYNAFDTGIDDHEEKIKTLSDFLDKIHNLESVNTEESIEFVKFFMPQFKIKKIHGNKTKLPTIKIRKGCADEGSKKLFAQMISLKILLRYMLKETEHTQHLHPKLTAILNILHYGLKGFFSQEPGSSRRGFESRLQHHRSQLRKDGGCQININCEM